MNITLFRDIPDEKFYSMERYSDALASKLKIHLSTPSRQARGRSRSPLRSEKSEVKVKEFTIRMTRFVRPMRAVLRWIPVVKDYAFDLYFSRYVLYPRRAKKHQGDVNHVIDHSYAHLLYHLDPERTVVTCHDLIPLEYEKDPVALKIWKYSVEGMRRAAMIIADSGATKKDIVAYFSRHPDSDVASGEGSPKIRGGFFGRKLPQNDESGWGEKIRVIYLGVGEKFKPIKDKKLLRSIEKKYNLPDGKRLLHVGNSLGYKNVEGILRAFAEILHSRHPELVSGSSRFRGATIPDQVRNDALPHFVKVGLLTEAQEKLAKELGISDQIIQLKDVIEEDLPAIYNVCDVLVMPSLKEGFGFPVLEAMACGLPVVTSNVSSLPEVAGKAAALVNPKDHKEIAEAIIKVLDDESYCKELIDSGLKRAKGFSWTRTAEKTAEVYREVYEKVNKV